MRFKIFAVLALLLTGVLVFVGINSASAHTPSISASCQGVTAGGTNYGGDGFDWSITVGGVTTSGHKGDAGSETVAVPQGGASTAWSASIDAPGTQYDASDSGTVGPCGEVPPPVDVCPDIPGDQPEGTDCTPPPVDVCPDVPGDQPEGTDCNPVTPPTDNPPTEEPPVVNPPANPPVEDTPVLPDTGAGSWVLGIVAVFLIALGILVLSPWKNKILPKRWNRKY